MKTEVENMDRLWLLKVHEKIGLLYGCKAGLWAVRAQNIKKIDFKNLIVHNRAT